MKDPKGLTPSVAEEIAAKLFPNISKMIHGMGVAHLQISVEGNFYKFTYKGLEVTIQIKTK